MTARKTPVAASTTANEMPPGNATQHACAYTTEVPVLKHYASIRSYHHILIYNHYGCQYEFHLSQMLPSLLEGPDPANNNSPACKQD